MPTTAILAWHGHVGAVQAAAGLTAGSWRQLECHIDDAGGHHYSVEVVHGVLSVVSPPEANQLHNELHREYELQEGNQSL